MQVRRSTLLAAAFAALILVIGAAAIAVSRDARNSQQRVANLHDAHVRSAIALSSIRANVYLVGILTRDYLLDLDSGQVRQYDQQFQEIRAKIASDFGLLDSGVQDPQQRAALDRLRAGVDAYWDPTALVLDWTPEQVNARRSGFLRERGRRREEISGLATQVERLMADNFSREQLRIQTANEDFRQSLAWTAGMCLILGLAIALITMLRMNTLERRSEASESELRLLSIQARTAQEQERKYLSRELHDQVGQMLTGMRMELSSMARLHGDSESELSSRIAHAKGIVEQTLAMVRDIAMLLRPSMLDDLGLAPALAWLAKNVSRTSGILIETDIDPALDSLPDAYRTCLYRVVQEALTNASRHSHARSVKVLLRSDRNGVSGTIRDDGQGFDQNVQRASGLGLLGIGERVRELGGRVQVVSAPGRGMSVELHLPVPKDTEGENDSDPDRRRSRDRSSGVEASA